MIHNKKTIALKVWTTEGNAEGFQSDIERGRFWGIDEWKSIIHNIVDNGYCPMFVGINNEDGDLRKYCDTNNISYFDGMGLSVEETIELLKQVDGGIFCNSWEWEVTSRIGIPTVCFYTKNHFFIENHTPSGPSEFWDTCYIETNPIQTDNAHISGQSTASEKIMKGKQNAEDIWFKMNHLLNNKKRPDIDYSVCMITLNDEDCVQTTLENIKPYIVDDFVITDGGSTDNTIELLKQFQSDVAEDKVKVLNKPWEDCFDIQKNNSLDGCNSEWRVWIDADESFEPLFWNQLPWYIADADRNGVDCINVPRINTITDLNPQQLQEYAQNNNWGLSYFGWVAYPDYQQRVFKSNCRFKGRTHERIVGMNKESALVGVHCLHPKKKSRQQRGLDREAKQFKIEAEKVRDRINAKNITNKKVVMHYLHHLGIGGTAKVVHLLGKYLNKVDNEFHHVVAYKVHGELEREQHFEEAFGRDNMIPIASIPEFHEVVKEVKPHIMHRQAAGIAEFPFSQLTKQYTKHFVSTSIFGYIDRSPWISRYVYISNFMYHHSGKFGGDKASIIGIPIESPYTTEDLREELDIPKDAFVFGRVGRDDSDIFDPINLNAFSHIENENTYFICLSPSEAIKEKAVELGIKNIRYVDKTIDDVRISKFYNTMDVLAHARMDGECNPGNIREAFAHGKPVISHYAIPYNGHIQEIGNCGFTVNKVDNFHNLWQDGNPSSLIDIMNYSRERGYDNFTAEDRKATIKNDVDEYTRIMQAFVDGNIDYDILQQNCLKNWKENSHPELIAQQHIDLYRGLS